MKPTVITANNNTATASPNPGAAIGGSNGGGYSNSDGTSKSSPAASSGINIPVNHDYETANYTHSPRSSAHVQHIHQPIPPYHMQQQQQPQHQQPNHHHQSTYPDSSGVYGSPNTQGGNIGVVNGSGSGVSGRHPQHHPSTSSSTQQMPPHPQQSPSHQPSPHFQGFGFEPDMDMDMDMNMFPRSRMGRTHHDPFSSFVGNARKPTTSNAHPTRSDDGFSLFDFDDGADFPFSQFGSLGRRRAAGGDPMMDGHRIFNHFPPELRQYIPEGFGHRRPGSGTIPTPNMPPTQQGQYYQNYGTTPPSSNMQSSPSKKVCDAAIQTEERSEVDGDGNFADNLQHHGLRNTMDMGVRNNTIDGDMCGGNRSQSAPPNEQQQSRYQQSQQQQIPINNSGHQCHQQSPPSSQQQQQQPQFQKVYYAPQQQPHPQQKQQTPPPTSGPQTPGGSYVRTIPIFVEGRSEPIINTHKDIPNQNVNNSSNTATATANARAYAPTAQPQQQFYQHQPPQQHQPQHQYQQPTQQHNQHQQTPTSHRPSPLNTQQSSSQTPSNTGQHFVHQQHQQQTPPPQQEQPPQTPHTMDSINKIQNIQRDVLDLMGKVEKFTGSRKDKEYVYLDEMLTRNLLKLDTIDTNGKDSIRLARKEAIKCIQASINVLEAKAEENAKKIADNDADSGDACVGGNDEASANAELNGENLKTKTSENTKTTANQSTKDVTKEVSPTKKDTAPPNSVVDKEPKQDYMEEQQQVDITRNYEPIPLPPPDSKQNDESKCTKTSTKSTSTPMDNEQQQATETKATNTEEDGDVAKIGYSITASNDNNTSTTNIADDGDTNATTDASTNTDNANTNNSNISNANSTPSSAEVAADLEVSANESK